MYHPNHRSQQPCCPSRHSTLPSPSSSPSPGTTTKGSSHRHIAREPTCMSHCSSATSNSYSCVTSSSSSSSVSGTRNHKSKDKHSNQKKTCSPSVLRHRITGMEGKKWTNLSSWTSGRVDVIDFGGSKKKKDKNSGSRRRSSASFVQASFCTSSSCHIYSEATGGEVRGCYTQMYHCATSTSGTGTTAESDGHSGGRYSYNYEYNHIDTSSSTHYTTCCTPKSPETTRAPSRKDKRHSDGDDGKAINRPASRRVPDLNGSHHTGSEDSDSDSDDEDGDDRDGEMDQLTWALRESKLCSPRHRGGEPSHLSTITGPSYSFFPPSSTSSSSSDRITSSVSCELPSSAAEPRPQHGTRRRRRRSSSPAASITPSSSASRAPSPIQHSRRRRRQSRATAPQEEDMEKWASLGDDGKFPSDKRDTGTADDDNDLPPRYSDLSFRSPRSSSVHGRGRDIGKDLAESSSSSRSCSLGERECSRLEKWLAERPKYDRRSGPSRRRSSTSKSRHH